MRVLYAIVVLVLLASPAIGAAEEATWVREPSISPDGSRIVLRHRGDLWLVAAQGGEARRLTTHEGVETRPVWSRDGTRIAFASNRFGNFDVFVMAAEGGSATRLTAHSADDFPCDFEPDGARVLFTSTRQDDPAAILPSPRIPELWSVPVAGGRERLELSTPAEWARISPDGAVVAYEDRKGYEDTWRKHHVSPVTRDVWLWHRRDGRHERVTTFGGEDRNPAFSPDGKGLYYLSEAEGTSNVRRWTRDGSARVTSHETHPVRYLTVAADGTLCYGWDGGVYVVKDEPSARPRRVEIRVAADDRVNDVVRLTRRKDATEIAVSPKGDEIAFVVRGDVFVASTEHGTTRRVTATPEQERSISWGPDGTWMVYGAERACSGSDGPSWNLFRASLARAEEDERFFRATLITEEPLFACPADSLQPVVSPDGTKVAFLRDRDELCVLDVATRAVTSVLPAEANYSYLDGDIRYEWSPDSKWLAVNYLPNRSWIAQVGVIEVATGKVVDVTASGYEVNLPKWSRDGRALLFLSEQHGRRSHSASGAEVDAIAFLLNRAAFDRAVLSEEEYERLEEREAAEKKKRRGEGKGAGEGADDKDEAEAEVPPPVVEIDFAYPERRRRRVTLQSAPIADYVLSPPGERT